MKHNIEYIETDERDLDLIADLWWKLRQHHKMRAPEYFAGQFEKMPWNLRKKLLLDKTGNGGAIRIDLAQDENSKVLVGYCVSSVTEKKQGEIESIYVEEEYRKNGIGEAFMQKALRWLKSQAVARIIIGVGAGNEEVLSFYRRYGFCPRTTILEQVEKKK
jgi:ribosomal protein S18 acetylase RimI-like enzyme